MGSFFRKVFRFGMVGLGIATTLLLVLFIVLQLQPIQQFLAKEGSRYLKDSFGIQTKFEGFYISISGKLYLQNLWVANTPQDTLLLAKCINISFQWKPLLHRQVVVEKIAISGATFKLIRPQADTLFNYQKLLMPFSSTQSTSQQHSISWQWRVQHIQAANIHFAYHDFYDGVKLILQAQLLEALQATDTSGLTDYSIPLQRLSVYNSEITYLQFAPSHAPTSAFSAPTFNLAAQEVDLKKFSFHFQDNLQGEDFQILVKKANAQQGKLHLADQTVDIQKVMLEEAVVLQRQTEASTDDLIKGNQAPTTAQIADTNNWKIIVHQSQLYSSRLGFKQDSSLQDSTPLLYLTIHESKINDLIFHQNTLIQASVQSFRAHTPYTPEIQQLTGKFTSTLHSFSIKDLDAKVGRSHLVASVSGHMSVLDWQSDAIHQKPFFLNLTESLIYPEDLLTIFPSLRSKNLSFLTQQAFFRVHLQAFGKLANIYFNRCQLATANESFVDISGRIKSILNPEQLNWNLDKLHIRAGQSETQQLLKHLNWPTSLRIPPYIEIKATTSGKLKHFQVQAFLNNPAFQLTALGIYQHREGRHHIQTEVTGAQIDLPELLQESQSVGRISFTAFADGRGSSMNWDTWQANGGLFISQLTYQGKHFENINWEGNFQDSKLASHFSIADSSVKATLQTNINFSLPYLQASLTGHIQKIDFKQLPMFNSSWMLSTDLKMNVSDYHSDSTYVQMELNNLVLADTLKQYVLSSISASLLNSPKNCTLQIDSDALHGFLSAESSLEEYFRQLSALSDIQNPENISSLLSSKLLAYHVPSSQLKLRIQPDTIIQSLLDLLQLNINDIAVNVNWYSPDSTLALQVQANDIAYNKQYQAKNLVLDIQGNPDTLLYDLSTDSFSANEWKVRQAALKGYITPHGLISRIHLKNEVASDSVQLSFTITFKKDVWQLSFLPENHILINQPWNINEGNYIFLRKDGLYQADLHMESDGWQLTIETLPKDIFTKHLHMQFQGLNLARLNRFLPSQTEIGGKLSGTMEQVDNLHTIEANMQVDSLALSKHFIGNLKLQGSIKQLHPGDYTYELSLRKDETEWLNGEGTYKLSDSVQANHINFNFQQVDLSVLQPLLDSTIQDLDGTLQGVVKLKGNIDSPQIEGYIIPQQVTFRPVTLHTLYHLDSDTIKWQTEGIQFNNTTLSDSFGNLLSLTGTIHKSTLQQWNYQLSIKSNGIQILNTSAKENPVFFGALFAEADLQVMGSLNQPIVKGTLTINRKMDLQYKNLESLALQEYEGLVKFITTTTPDTPSHSTSKRQTNDLWNALEMHLNVQVEEGGKVYFLFNVTPEESIEITGGGSLSLTKLSGRAIQLTGIYQLSAGKVVVSTVIAASKELTIQPGSQVEWSGDPYNPLLNIEARKSVRASVSELIGSKTTSAPSYIDVVLRAQNQLQAMSLQFNLESQNQEATYAIRQLPAEEIENQAINLLLFDQFYQPNTSNNTDYLDLNNRMNEFLTGRLNSLTSQAVKNKNVDINFNYETFQDASEGIEKNSLTYQVSKKFDDNRAVLRVGGYLAGYNAPTSKDLNNLIGDLVLEYYVQKGGKNYLKVFRQTSYEDLLEGEITKSGVGFVFQRSYPDIKSVFKRQKQGKRKK